MVEPLAVQGTPSLYQRPQRPRALRPRSPDLRLWRTNPVAKPDPLVTLVERLAELAELEPNWDTYGAEPPSEKALRRALGAIQRTWMSLLPVTALPSVEGGIILVYSTDADRYAEIEFGNDGEVVAAFRRPAGRPKVWSVRDDLGVVAAVTEIRRHLGSSG